MIRRLVFSSVACDEVLVGLCCPLGIGLEVKGFLGHMVVRRYTR